MVLDPEVVDLVEVTEVVRLVQLHRVFVVERAEAVELVVEPLAVVGRVARTVVENSLASHLVVPELALVVGLVLEDELARTVLLAVERHALVPTPVLVGFDGEYCAFLGLFAHVHVLHGRHFVPVALVVPLGHVVGGRSCVLDLELVLVGLQFFELCGPVAPVGDDFLDFSEVAADDLGLVTLQLCVLDGVHDGLSLWVPVAVLPRLVECALLELVDVLQVLPDHLQQLGVRVNAVVFLGGGYIFGSD